MMSTQQGTTVAVARPHYRMEITWSDEDEAYIVTVPDLPGCMTHGATYEEAARMGEDAIDAWLAGAQHLGRTIPEPTPAPPEGTEEFVRRTLRLLPDMENEPDWFLEDLEQSLRAVEQLPERERFAAASSVLTARSQAWIWQGAMRLLYAQLLLDPRLLPKNRDYLLAILPMTLAYHNPTKALAEAIERGLAAGEREGPF